MMPLAAELRPKSLAEMVGQEHLLGSQGLLTLLISKSSMPSLILWGPPGCGKTTLAENIARAMRRQLIRLSAVSAGVKEIRDSVEIAKKTPVFLFVDEIHRFNKAQQDVLLPYVEEGLLTLIGATTENPSFSINNALLSRCRVLVLKPISDEDLNKLADKALSLKNLSIEEEARRILIESAAGDARVLLSTLEVALSLAASEILNIAEIKQAIGKRVLAYDRKSEEHYNTISAFIKSMRASDPDAACYYLARMLEAGEDPRFVGRRMMIFASEDIGNGDPRALLIAVSALQAYELMGLPEGVLPLTQAATYLAKAPKSRAVINAYYAAKEDVLRLGSEPIPMHLRNAPTKLMKELGSGQQTPGASNLPE
ncbi:MAG: replication-associated recombination protein A, partial [Myxococcaceae bacterium]